MPAWGGADDDEEEVTKVTPDLIDQNGNTNENENEPGGEPSTRSASMIVRSIDTSAQPSFNAFNRSLDTLVQEVGDVALRDQATREGMTDRESTGTWEGDSGKENQDPFLGRTLFASPQGNAPVRPKPAARDQSPWDTLYAQPGLNCGVKRERQLNKAREVADNIPRRFELFILGEGEKKVTMEIDTRIPSSAIFHFNKEDHTLGNLLRSRLLSNQHVTFAGYKMPHPLVAKFELRVQTDGEVTPRDALVASCRAIVADLAQLSKEFTKEWELKKMVGGASGGGGPNGSGPDLAGDGLL
ncbi:MAG: DNA-directed RNA polymerase II core subunit [Sclerophora amabilis]|nr:MAG: DNA-directed RNA polymerase II core subunit [Sclerophora amabilis]